MQSVFWSKTSWLRCRDEVSPWEFFKPSYVPANTLTSHTRAHRRAHTHVQIHTHKYSQTYTITCTMHPMQARTLTNTLHTHSHTDSHRWVHSTHSCINKLTQIVNSHTGTHSQILIDTYSQRQTHSQIQPDLHTHIDNVLPWRCAHL